MDGLDRIAAWLERPKPICINHPAQSELLRLFEGASHASVARDHDALVGGPKRGAAGVCPLRSGSRKDGEKMAKEADDAVKVKTHLHTRHDVRHVPLSLE